MFPVLHHRPRRSIDPRVNLSSNELRHPAAAKLVGELMLDFDPVSLIRYPIQDTAVRSGAEFLGLHPDKILLSPGSDAAIRMLLTTLRGSGRRLLLQEPNYEVWTTGPEAQYWDIVRVPASDGTAAGSLRALVGELAGASPAVVVLSWPNSPGGYTPDLATVAELSQRCALAGHLLVLDACYAGFATDPRKVLRLADRHCLILMSWSKMFGTAGGRLAVVTGAQDVLELLAAHGLEQHVGAPMLHAFARTPLVYERLVKVWQEIAARRETVQARLRVTGLHCPDSGGNFLHVATGSAQEARSLTGLLSAAGFRVRNMETTTGLFHHVRFTVGIGSDDDRFQQLLEEAVPR
jgi:histidinol-phosphate aminotransferase